MNYLRLALVAILFFLVSGFTECYKPVTNSGLPKHIKTVAVPVFQFEARGLRYRVESRFTEAVIREVIRRGNGLKVQGNMEGADAVIARQIRDRSVTKKTRRSTASPELSPNPWSRPLSTASASRMKNKN